MKITAAAFVTGVMLVSASAYAQQSLSGRYTGNYVVYTAKGPTPVGLTLVIDSVEGVVVKGTATSYGRTCGGDFPIEGQFKDNKLQLSSTTKGGSAGDCIWQLNLTVEGNKLTGTTGLGNAVQLSK